MSPALALIELPLFPLPNVVFFPETRLPLHIFEPRYRRMVRDLLEGDRRIIGLTLLKPGWEGDYEGSPDVHAIGGAGEIESCEPRDDGKYDIVLRGVFRFRLEEELSPAAEPYRTARVVALPEVAVDDEDGAVVAEKAELLALFKRFLGEVTREELPDWQPESFTYQGLVNACSAALEMPAERKQALLEMNSLRFRRDTVTRMLASRLGTLDLLRPYRQAATDASRN